MTSSIKSIIKSLGIVFGDIGTSPIYTLTVIFTLIPATVPNVMGILSLIIWTLLLLVTVQYAWLAMKLSDKGEGGTIVLKKILTPLLSSKRQIALVTFLAFLGISFFIGDGVITPAISILSAVEGLELIPSAHGLPQEALIIIACVITLLLFIFQKWGTERVSIAFGPIMLVWFIFLGISGLICLWEKPFVIAAINPLYGISFLLNNGIIAFLLLSKIILCATGGEALYADMGHLGRKPIVWAWVIAFSSLCLTYLGQGAFLLQNTLAHNVFYELILKKFSAFFIPLLLLSIIATVIASQAMISGIFSIVYQGITTNILPRLHVEYTSRKLMSQIYIPSVNWFLLAFVLFAIIRFKSSYFLANAYGLAASATMTITAILLTWIFIVKRDLPKVIIALFITIINSMFLLSNTYKIPYGGYWSLMIASLPFCLILIYTQGQKKLYRSLKQLPIDNFLEKYLMVQDKITKVSGTAVFLAKTVDTIPSYIAHVMFINGIIYEENVIVSVITQEKPYGLSGHFKEDLAPGLRIFEIKVGYMEIMHMEKVLNAAYIYPKSIFYGLEDINSKHIIWKIYTLIKKLTPSFVQFYKLPEHKLHGVVVRATI